MFLPSTRLSASQILACMAILAVSVSSAWAQELVSGSDGETVQLRSQPHQSEGGALAPPLPDPLDFPLQLVIDDDSVESDFGLVGANSEPFMWFNRFTAETPFALEQMWVLFPQDPVLSGAAVQLAVYQDPDGDPTNGAELLATYDVTVEENDGVTFSVYELVPPVEITGGDAYLGVVSRYAEAPTPPTFPATLDTDDSQGRSWVAVWTGGPPPDPTLPGDDETFIIDTFQPGNWMIRGFGRSTLDVLEIPTLGGVGLAALFLVLSALGTLMLSRRRTLAPRRIDESGEVN